MAAPPDVLRVDQKHIHEHFVFNVTGVTLTTNYKSDGIYLPADDRRHFVCWSDAKKEDFTPEYWNEGGVGTITAGCRTWLPIFGRSISPASTRRHPRRRRAHSGTSLTPAVTADS